MNIRVSVPVSTFMRLWAIYIFPRSVCLSCWRKYVDRSWDYINRSQTYECWNWGWGRAIPRKGINKWDFCCSAVCWWLQNLILRYTYKKYYFIFLSALSAVDLRLLVFSWTSFPQAPEYTIRAISIFFYKFTEIFAAQGAPPVVDTGGIWKKSSIIKVLIIVFRHLREVELT